MVLKILRYAILTSIFLFGFNNVGALELLPLNGDWLYIKTEHFKVYFQPGQESFAERTADRAETIHVELVKFLKWLPYGHTNIIIADHTDIVNDYATPLPKRTIIIYPAQNIGDRNNFDDWLYEVLVHEYTHILQMDMQSGFPAGFNSFFGRIFLPNIFQPLNQIEGLAVYAESDNPSLGRNNSALSDGMLRATVNDGKWIPLDRAGVASPCWPRDASYIYGGKFYQYLSEKYGQRRLAQYQRKHSNLVIPWMQNMPAKGTFGKSFPQLWDQWRRHSFKRYSVQAESINAQGITSSTHLSNDGFDKNSLTGSPDGKFLAYIDRNSHRRTSLKLFDISSGASRSVDEGIFTGSVDFSKEGNILAYAKMEYTGTGEKLFSDIYIFEPGSEKISRLTKGLRARDPAFSADGKRIYFVQSRMDQNALAVMDLRSKNIEYITVFDGEQLFSHPKTSPDGSFLALNVWQPGGYQDIWLFALDKEEWYPVMLDKSQDISPSWSADSKNIYFASDRSGVWNIYRYSIEGNSFVRITNVIGGAFDPVYKNEKLYFLDLGPNGYDLVVTEKADSFDCGDEHHGQKADLMVDQPDSSGFYPSKTYCSAKTMLPFFWFPAGIIDEKGGAFGMMLTGSDDLMLKAYTALVAPGFKSDRFYYQLAFSDKSRSIKYGLQISDITTSENVHAEGKDTTYYQRKQSQGITFSLPVTRSQWSFTAGLGYRHNNYIDLNGDIFDLNPYWTGYLSCLQLDLDFTNAVKYGFSISPEKGRSISVESRLYRKELGSDLNQQWNSVWWREYLPTPFRHHVLMASIRGSAWGKGGYVDEDIPDIDPRGFDYLWRGSRYRTLLTTEYRFPIAYVERGYSTWPFYLKNFNGALIMDAGYSTDSRQDIALSKFSRVYGGELHSEWLFSYTVPFDLIVGLYHHSDMMMTKLGLKLASGSIW
jgi:hypothetical protein